MDLSIEDASKMFSGAVLAAHPLDEIRAKLAEIHAGNPTRSALAQMAMDEIKAGLDRLAALGHAFHLSPSSGQVPLAFPQMLYKDGQPEMTVESQDELNSALADGWQGHPTERKPIPATASPSPEPEPAPEPDPQTDPQPQPQTWGDPNAS